MSMSSPGSTAEAEVSRYSRSFFSPYYTGYITVNIGSNLCCIVPNVANGKITILSTSQAPKIDIKPLVQSVINVFKSTNEINLPTIVDSSWRVAVSYGDNHSLHGKQKIGLAVKILTTTLDVMDVNSLLHEEQIIIGKNLGPGVISELGRSVVENDLVDSVVQLALRDYKKDTDLILMNNNTGSYETLEGGNEPKIKLMFKRVDSMKRLATTIWNITNFNNDMLYWAAKDKIRVATHALEKALDIFSDTFKGRISERDILEGKIHGHSIMTTLAKELLERERFARSEVHVNLEGEYYNMDTSSDDDDDDDCRNPYEDYKAASRRSSMEWDEKHFFPEITSAFAPPLRSLQPQDAKITEEYEFEVLIPEDDGVAHPIYSMEDQHLRERQLSRRRSSDISRLLDYELCGAIERKLFGTPAPDVDGEESEDVSIYNSEHIDEFEPEGVEGHDGREQDSLDKESNSYDMHAGQTPIHTSVSSDQYINDGRAAQILPNNEDGNDGVDDSQELNEQYLQREMVRPSFLCPGCSIL